MNSIVYNASAGSGKTFQLALKYISLLLQGSTHRHILAVTFTKDATSEMKDRILAELYGLAHGLYLEGMPCYERDSANFISALRGQTRGLALTDEEITRRARAALSDILEDYSHFHVTTIDSFFLQVVRGLAHELGIPSGFNIELNTQKAAMEATRSFMENANDRQMSNIMKYVESNLNDTGQWNVEGSLCKFADNLFREAFLEHEKQLEEDLRAHPTKIEDIIRQCYIIKRGFDEVMEGARVEFESCGLAVEDFWYGSRGLPSYFNKLPAVANSYVEKVMSGKARKNETDYIIAVACETEQYRSENIREYNSACLLLQYIYQLQLIEDIAFELQKTTGEVNTFMLAHQAKLLADMIDGSDAPFIYEKIDAEIRHIIIDEFQDTSTLQWRNFEVLIKEAQSKGYFTMLVGDVKQSIYRWRNGDWRILNNMDGEPLSINYRSARNIVEFNNLFFEAMSQRSDNEHVEKAYSRVRQQPNKREEGSVTVRLFSGKNKDEAMVDALVVQIGILLSAGVAQQDICILCRRNNDITYIAKELPNRLPSVRIISENAYKLGASPVLCNIIAGMRLIAQPENPIPQVELAQSGFAVSSVRELASLPIYELAEALACLVKPANSDADVFLYAFMDKLSAFVSRNPADLNAFLKYWDDTLRKDAVPVPTGKHDRRNGILAMTIHKSKGLQFHTVIVIDRAAKTNQENIIWCTEEHAAPFNLAITPVKYGNKMKESVFDKEYEMEMSMQMMDDINVQYVAFTRAKNNLVIVAYTTDKGNEFSEVVNGLDFFDDISDGVYTKGALFVDSALRTEADGGYVSHNVFREQPSELIDCPYAVDRPNYSFKQTRGARRFVKGEEDPDTNEYVMAGKLIHSIMENIVTVADIDTAIQKVVDMGITDGLHSGVRLREQIAQYLDMPECEEWFSGKYLVLNECEILSKEGVYRCDRVMLDDEGNAIVVDYKTGVPSQEHIEQIKEYMSLLQEMNYKPQGYVWYLNNRNIIKV